MSGLNRVLELAPATLDRFLLDGKAALVVSGTKGQRVLGVLAHLTPRSICGILYLVYQFPPISRSRPMEKQAFHKIEPRSLSQEVLHMLRDAILSGELLPGQHLNERVIAKESGVSRIPVREAIQQLEHQGLVISTPNRGSYVRYFDAKDIAEIFDLRAVLEGLACEMIVKDDKLTSSDFDLLKSYAEEQQKAVAAGDYDSWVEAEIQFHTFICKKAGSSRLFEMWHNLHVQCLFATRDNWELYLRAYGSHPVILDALRRGDPRSLIPLHQEIYTRVKESTLKLAS